MGLGKDLASKANTAPPEDICHKAVLHWLVQASAISGKDKDRLNATKANEWGSVLASPSDKQYTKGDLGSAPAGTVLGFYTKDNTLQHSMVAMGDSVIAGVNNANVISEQVAMKVGIKYARVGVDQLNWVDNSRVGINQCIVRGATPEVVAKRIKG